MISVDVARRCCLGKRVELMHVLSLPELFCTHCGTAGCVMVAMLVIVVVGGPMAGDRKRRDAAWPSKSSSISK